MWKTWLCSLLNYFSLKISVYHSKKKIKQIWIVLKPICWLIFKRSDSLMESIACTGPKRNWIHILVWVQSHLGFLLRYNIYIMLCFHYIVYKHSNKCNYFLAICNTVSMINNFRKAIYMCNIYPEVMIIICCGPDITLINHFVLMFH